MIVFLVTCTAVALLLIAGTVIRVDRRTHNLESIAGYVSDLRTVGQLAAATYGQRSPRHCRVIDSVLRSDLTGMRVRAPRDVHWRQFRSHSDGRHVADTDARAD